LEMAEKESLSLTILMPCLNEAATVGISIREAVAFLEKNRIWGEILVVDNGSVDGSAAIAERCGARVIIQPQKGYGNALRMGIAHSRGRVIILGTVIPPMTSFIWKKCMPCFPPANGTWLLATALPGVWRKAVCLCPISGAFISFPGWAENV